MKPCLTTLVFTFPTWELVGAAARMRDRMICKPPSMAFTLKASLVPAVHSSQAQPFHPPGRGTQPTAKCTGPGFKPTRTSA